MELRDTSDISDDDSGGVSASPAAAVGSIRMYNPTSIDLGRSQFWQLLKVRRGPGSCINAVRVHTFSWMDLASPTVHALTSQDVCRFSGAPTEPDCPSTPTASRLPAQGLVPLEEWSKTAIVLACLESIYRCESGSPHLGEALVFCFFPSRQASDQDHA